MMKRRTALCLDEATCCNPELIGLKGEAIGSQDWLEVCTTGGETRDMLAASDEVAEVWVVSCDDVEPINLAASLKADKPEVRVSLIAPELHGSLLSRAYTADIDEVIDVDAFIQRYSEEKQLHCPVPRKGTGGTSDVNSAGREGYGPKAKSGFGGKDVSSTADDAQGSTTSRSIVLSPIADPIATEPVQPSLSLPLTRPCAETPPVATDSRAFVLTVVSGSGGAGKSSVSALGAVVAQEMGYRTLLLDCDLQFGDVDVLVGAENPFRIDELLLHPERLDSELAQRRGLSVLAAPIRLESSEEVAHILPSLFDRLATMFEVIVVNTGASWAEQHAVLLERSSASLFLIDQRASSVRACRHALELCARCGIATNPFHFALNRCAKGAPLTSIDASCALQGVSVYELRDGGREVEDYLSGGAPAELIEMKNEFARSLEQVMTHLLPSNNARLDDHVDEKGSRRLSLRRSAKASRKRGRSQK